MIYFTTGLIIILIIIGLALFAKLYGKASAELKQSNNNTEALKKDAKVDEHYRHTPLADARERMRSKVRKHNS